MPFLSSILQWWRVNQRTGEILELMLAGEDHECQGVELRIYRRKAKSLALAGASDYAILQRLYGHNQPQKLLPTTPKHDGFCTLCKLPNVSPVCLSCARKHRGEIQRVQAQRHRAKKAGAPATLTIAEWLHTLESFHHLCAYCQAKPYEVMEHYMPIAKGGGTTAENCIPACAKCNAEKSYQHPKG